MRHGWKEFFYFSKADRTVLMFLLGALVGVASCALFVLCSGRTGSHTMTKLEPEQSDSLFERSRDDNSGKVRKSYYYQQKQVSPETFYFDPNTADSTQLLRLGLQPWQVRNIYRYRSKGGKYHRPEDFSKLYGLTKGDYERLLPYIRIADEFKLLSDLPEMKEEKPERVLHRTYQEKLKEGEQISINTSDTTQLKKVPGIGSYYAGKITAYRKHLGGFTSLSQLAEIEGVPVDAIRWFTLDSVQVSPLYINRLSIDALCRHPYLNFYQGKVIIEHRRKYGPIKSLQSLSLYEEFSPSDLERLQPYVSFDE